jgi:tRNA uridine 5-carboxymethylaminomethyl modification enzyme
MDKSKLEVFDIIIIGAGLAGSEAGIISACLGQKTLLINISMDNPALLKQSAKIGGYFNASALDKINAFGGFINTAICVNKIAQKTEAENNYSAVSNIVDKRKFSLFYKYFLENQSNLITRQGLVTDIDICNEVKVKKYTVKLNDGSVFFSRAIIISTGTFFDAKVFWGSNIEEAGRHGEINSKMLWENLKKSGYDFIKEKIFIGPTIDKRTVNLRKIKKIKSEENVNIILTKELERMTDFNQSVIWQKYYSFKSKAVKNENIKYINEKGKNYKNNYFDKLANVDLYKGESEKIKNQELEIELMPEGDQTAELYVSGFNFSYSGAEQQEILNEFYGLENALIIRPGYCIEYEALKKGQLKKNMESGIHNDIYFAGEVNGSDGYENAIMQGLICGTNASLNNLKNSHLLTQNNYTHITKLIEGVVFGILNQENDKKNLKEIILEKFGPFDKQI